MAAARYPTRKSVKRTAKTAQTRAHRRALLIRHRRVRARLVVTAAVNRRASLIQRAAVVLNLAAIKTRKCKL